MQNRCIYVYNTKTGSQIHQCRAVSRPYILFRLIWENNFKVKSENWNLWLTKRSRVAGLFVMTSPRHHQGAHRPSLALQGVEQSRSVSDWLSEWMYHSVLIHPYYFNKVFHRFKSTLFFLVTEKMIEVTAVENFQQFLSNANVRRVMCDTFLISYWLNISLIIIRSR